jgi:hypothetical protein
MKIKYGEGSAVVRIIGQQGRGSLPLTYSIMDPKLREDQDHLMDLAEHMKWSIKIGCQKTQAKKKVLF